jgi:hypothetical protein
MGFIYLRRLGLICVPLLLANCGGSSDEASSSVMPMRQVAPVTATVNDEPLLGDAPIVPGFTGNATATDSRSNALRNALPDAGLSINVQDREAVRNFYNGMIGLTENVPIEWTGNYDTGNAGDTSQAFKNATLLRLNWYRAMAGLPANAAFNSEFNAPDQKAALMMSVAGKLSHTPESNWTFYSSAGYEGASHSNLSLGAYGPAAIDSYIWDAGANNAVVGHRRWIFYPQTTTFGTGDVPRGTYNGNSVWGSNALWTLGYDPSAKRPAVRDNFVAWPPSGYVPYQTVYGRWSFSLPQTDFSKATVEVSRNGAAIPVTIESTGSGAGESTIVWLLSGTTDATKWAKPLNDEIYNVKVTVPRGSLTPSIYEYTVKVFDPATQNAGAERATVSTVATVAANTPVPATVLGITNATGYELAALRRAAFTPTQLNGPALWKATTTGTYTAVGSNGFRLGHPTFSAQSIALNKPLNLGSTSKLQFSIQRGLLNPGQVFAVQASTDEGLTWKDLYSEKGDGTSQGSTRSVSLDLSAFARRPTLLRFYLPLPTGSIYICDTCVWTLTNLSMVDAELLEIDQKLPLTKDGGTLTFSRPGYYALYAKAQFQNLYYGESGWLSYLQVEGTEFTGKRANYSISKTDAGYTIIDNTGIDPNQTTAKPVKLVFTDTTIDLATDGKSAIAYRIYQAAFNRKPDLAGLGFWIKALEQGVELDSVARDFVNSTEFKNLYGTSVSDDQFLTLLYNNVLHRSADPSGYSFWLKALTSGVSRPHVLAQFSESPENRANVSTDISKGIEYTPYR